MTDGWYRALQLERDPFAVPGPFFSGGGRRQLLQQMVQQLHFSAGSVVVLGEAGSGVSTLLEAAVRQLSGIADVLLISADDIHSPEALWTALGGATISRSAEAIHDADSWLAARRQMGPRDGSALPLVVAVDDAQRLGDNMLHSLLRLEQMASTELRLLLGAEPVLVPRLSISAVRRLCLRLPALDCAAIADYVLTRLQAAGYIGELPLDALQLEALRQHSDGIPGRVHALLPPLLSSPPPAVSTQTLRSLPLTHLLGVAGLITVVVIGLLYWGGADPESDEHELASRTRTPLQLPGSDAGNAASTTDPGSGTEGRGPRRTASQIETQTQAQTKAPIRTQTEAETPASRPASPQDRPDDSLRNPPAANDPISELSGTQSPPSSATDTARTPTPAATDRPDSTAADPGAALSADERALLELPADSYVLQLFAARDRQRVIDFARTAPPGLRIYRFETRLSGAPWHVAVTGPYTNDAAARAAEARLPAAMRSAKPWPRAQADVAQAIRDLRGIGH